MNPENKTFCMAPWVHMNIGPNGDVYPCCLMPICDNEQEGEEDGEKLSPLEIKATECDGDPREFRMGSLMDESLKQIWNNENMRELRRNMIAGKKSSYCTSCYKEEEIGHGSPRQTFNDTYSKHYKYVKETKEDGTFERFNLVYWDFRLNNICNFKCRMCSPGYSSAWEQEMRKQYNIVGEYPKIDVDMVYQDIEPLYDIVEEIYFAGGEPLISDHHYKILNKLIEKFRNRKVKLAYNTNFSTLKYKDQ
ncbi:twitch domain-containing radical SAM protein, partial [archaeon]|nr:twitch domain-containing radical SAM protein [archaeon]